MGVDAGDVNGDGRPDFIITNFNDQYHSLLVGTNSLTYRDQTVESGLARYSKKFVGWGVHFIDFDNDGNLDLFIVNGHINEAIEVTRVDVKYKEPLLMFENVDGKYKNVSAISGSVFGKDFSARGLAIGDWNNDGRMDVVFTCCLARRQCCCEMIRAARQRVDRLRAAGHENNRDAVAQDHH
jgi:hypothetical protein